MTSNPAELAHIVFWDAEFKRPIVDGKITHPITGEIIKAGNDLIDGPPSVQIHILNMNVEVSPSIVSLHSPVPMEKVFLAVARHVRNGIYKLESINATEYSFIIVCKIQVSEEEFWEAWNNKYTDLL